MITILRQAWINQYKARTRFYLPDETDKLERAKKLTTACLRFSNEFADIAPYPGEFEVEEFQVIRRRVDEIDNLYVRLK